MAALQRQSGIELLRIIAMFLVLGIHADFLALGMPDINEFRISSISTVVRVFIESLTVVCVNVFVLISGWFGIYPKIKSVGKFIFQCLFFLIGIYVVVCIAGNGPKGVMVTMKYFFMNDGYWFVKSYIVLMILAPEMNLFAEKSSQKLFLTILRCFFSFQAIYGGWFSHSAVFFVDGYSAMSMIGFYLLARYIKKYPSKLTSLRHWQYLGLYILIAVVMTAMSIASIVWFPPLYADMIVNKLVVCYVNPFTILAALFLFLFFAKLEFYSKTINWIASSCFAVYLLHTNTLVFDKFLITVQHLFANNRGIKALFLIFLFLVGVFIVSVLVDKVRLICWKCIDKVCDGIRSKTLSVR